MRILLSIIGLPLALFLGCKGQQEQAKSTPSPASPASTSAAAAPASPASSTPAAGGSVADAPAQEGEKSLPDASDDSLFFSLERTPCFGRCPTYKVFIYESGSATYEGIRSVEREGRYTGHVDRAQMDALYARAMAIGFFTLQDRYDSPVTDLPSTIFRLRANGQDKQVVGRVGTPQPLKAFAVYADSLFANMAWTKVAEAQK